MRKVSAFLRHVTTKLQRPVGKVDIRVAKSEQSWRAVEDVSNSFTRVVNNRAGPQSGRTEQFFRSIPLFDRVFSVDRRTASRKSLLDPLVDVTH